MADKELLNYGLVLQQLKNKIKTAKIQTVLAVNNELLKVYWEIGHVISEQEKAAGWGGKIVDKLASDLKIEFPEMRGLSARNLRYMRDFAIAYPRFLFLQQPAAKTEITENQVDVILQQAAAKLPWGHHQVLLIKLKTIKERCFYIQKAVENGWSRSVLEHHIEGGLQKAQGTLTNNFKNTLPEHESELTLQLFKEPYKLDFVMLGEQAKERDLEDALISHVTKLLLELGDGFAFMGRQRKFEAGGREFYIDLLFYHTKLRRHIIIELKVGEFEAEYVSKMNLYLGLADDQLKGQYDEPAIGLILCKTKNKIVAEYALRDTTKPIGIAEYKIAEILPEDIKGELPSIEEIESKLDEELKVQERPVSKFKQLMIKLEGLKDEEVKIKREKHITKHLFEYLVLPLKKRLYENIQSDIMPLFEHAMLTLWIDGRGFTSEEEAEAFFSKKEECQIFKISVEMNGFKKAGRKAFNSYIELEIYLDLYKYSIGFNGYGQGNQIERLYHQPITEKELDEVCELLKDRLLDTIISQVDQLNGMEVTK
jgi:predicted nuclease of restriction endonuclease-like (RecB) superfamily